MVAVLYVSGIAPNLRHLVARKRTLSTLPGLTKLAEKMGAPLPRRIKLVTIDKTKRFNRRNHPVHYHWFGIPLADQYWGSNPRS